MRGTEYCLGVRTDGGSWLLWGVEGAGDDVRSDTALLAFSNFVAASGGGKGDIESPEIEAAWAW